MITIIIAGGAGSRLWPLSTNEYPKHLLNLTGKETLVQGTLRRAKQLSDINKIYVVTDASHSHHIKDQLPEVLDENILIEPDRRDTAGCFAVALSHIQQKHDHNEPLAFMHADHYIRDTKGFARSFKLAGEFSTKLNRICLVGVEPTYPATGFGYIQKNGELDEEAAVFNAVRFKEKPDLDTAKEYLASGEYLWNAGYFVGSVNAFFATMSQDAPELKENCERLTNAANSEEYERVFLSFDKISIDYALMEKATNLIVAQASFDWMDLGSFEDAHKAASTDSGNNYISGEVAVDEVENAFIKNTVEGQPVAVVGLDNVVVVNTPHGILVIRKDLSQKVKEIAKKVNDK